MVHITTILSSSFLINIISYIYLLNSDIFILKYIYSQIKSYPRIIENSIGQTLCVKSKRAERRQAKIERKRKEKQAKLQELTRLRNLKLSMLAEKIERIKRTCGPGSLLLDANELIESQTKEYDSNDNNKLKNSTKVDVLDVAEYLDEDWDPEKHEKLLDSMFGKHYEEIDEEIKKPEFSDDSDLEVEPSVDDGHDSHMKQVRSINLFLLFFVLLPSSTAKNILDTLFHLTGLKFDLELEAKVNASPKSEQLTIV